MTFEELIRKDKSFREEVNYKNKVIANQLLDEYKRVKNSDGISCQETKDGLCNLISTYFLVKGTANQLLLEAIMEKYNFNYSASIRNAIIYLFGRKSEVGYSNPINWPGMIDIQEVNGMHNLNTIFGDIHVRKASPLFKNTVSSYVFQNHLAERCFNRSYDFISANKESSSVVLSYMPNSLFGGHYHAYLELGTDILDIASNSYYFSKDDSKKVLDGRTIRKLTYEEVEEEYSRLKQNYTDLQGVCEHKLYVLSLYYDLKDRL